MGIWRVTVEKRHAFQQPEGVEFSNVYTLSTAAGVELNGANAISSIVTLEKAVHGNAVSFDRATVYLKRALTGYDPFYGEDLSGTGQIVSGGGATDVYAECAILCQFELPRTGGLIGVGRSRRLSKWLHVASLMGSPTAGMITGRAALSTAIQAQYATSYGTPLRTNTHGGGLLCNEDGDRPIDFSVQPYVEHRQFHAGRKRKP